ncbi:outer membrane protein assembly factor BamB family protein [Tunicatimonas pelagia]|uniref:outer membrane protein assembly factor BamB family protein n=1 Tax=Tunicatimonas pelagia TaxID=931531 RepID=UPI002666BABD|nr:PQQ-binding-like beta-propeller repeat protein [Tunicatimonas pelagia]WKN44861.1 PQQ-binding-like beta-propeller repeat protein [Tunicatimonas pelagia]
MLLTLMGSCQEQTTTDNQSLNEREWRTYASDNKYSPLDQVNRTNVEHLREVWRYEEDSANGGMVAFNPLVAKGVMYVYTPGQRIVALNPLSGRKQWSFRPDSSAVRTNMKAVTFYDGQGKTEDRILFVHGTTLYALNARTGQLVSNFGHGGKLDFFTGLAYDPSLKSELAVTSNAPGVIYDDLFIVGCKVPDELPSLPGDVRAFNVHTGMLVWTFHTIPKAEEFGSDTWPKGARRNNGGANCWGGMSLDTERGIVYVPTASPSFDFYGGDREGQNLFANCLLALDAKTGKRIWHFQTTHHDLWDRDNGSPPNLLTLNHDGHRVDAVALVTKLGYVFTFDRETGEPLFPIEERPVPTTGGLPGEKPWPTQPFPTQPSPFARQGFRPEYISRLFFDTRAYIEAEIQENGYQTDVYALPNLKGSVIVPAAHGGANWGGASANPNTGMLFVNATDVPWFLQMIDNRAPRKTVEGAVSGASLYQKNCSSCHGADKQGSDFAPNITVKLQQYSASGLRSLLKNGMGTMPAFNYLSSREKSSLIAYLKNLDEGVNEVDNFSPAPEDDARPYLFSGYDFFKDQNGYPALQPPWGTLTAIDLNQGEIVWQVPLGENQTLAKEGIYNTGAYNRGGGIATGGGLIFIAAVGGDKKLRAFDQATGKILWETDLPGRGVSIPSTYAIHGQQYLTIGLSPDPATGFRGGYVTYGLLDNLPPQHETE